MSQLTLNEFSLTGVESRCPHCSDGPSEKWPHRDEALVRHLYNDHDRTQREIADDLGCSRGTIKTWFKKHDITVPRFEYEMPEEELRRLYTDEGNSISDVADHYGVTYTAVRHRLQIHDIEIRDSAPDYKHPEKVDESYKEESWLRQKYVEERLSKPEIAEMCSVAESTVQNQLIQHDIEARSYSEAQTLRRRKLNRPYDDEETLQRLYWDEGLTQREIADHFDVTQLPIQMAMERHNIDIRYAGANGQSYPTERGDYVRSAPERDIANWLYAHGVEYEYEPTEPETGLWADFLVDGRYVEYWGMLNREEYCERMHEKLAKYDAAGINPVNLFPYHTDDLGAKLSQFL